MVFSSAVLAALLLSLGIALVLPQLVLCVATRTHSEGQENFDPSLSTPTLTHEYKGPEDKVNNWRAALTEAADLAGLQLEQYSLESEFIEAIVESIRKILKEEESATAPSRRQHSENLRHFLTTDSATQRRKGGRDASILLGLLKEFIPKNSLFLRVYSRIIMESMLVHMCCQDGC
ncbi:hypothetical protein CMV_012185 [Castanea mollissima]|uniref:TIR domain-containing protein n=1 Tax=Castanea mollissima TaxID=60419 RepID=A0A8J4RBH5_9ROSI|nr:hypothetical protein CMV_012185 [Castanea mollissima]